MKKCCVGLFPVHNLSPPHFLLVLPLREGELLESRGEGVGCIRSLTSTGAGEGGGGGGVGLYR